MTFKFLPQSNSLFMRTFVCRFRQFSSFQATRQIYFNVGSTIHDARYRILKRLGEGQHSTVWLAEDLHGRQDSGGGSQQVSIKAVTDTLTSLQDTEAFELETFRRLRDLTSLRLPPNGLSHLLTLKDHFRLSSDVEGQGRSNHLCLVTEVLGEDLLIVRQSVPNRRLPVSLVKIITKQLLLALDTLHACGIIHTDIKLDSMHFAQGATEYAGVHGATCSIKLIDYGSAMPTDIPQDRIIQPEALRAPEVLLGCSWDTKADIWNLGCIVFELLTGNALFRLRSGKNFTKAQHHLACMVAFLHDASTPSDWTKIMDLFRQGKEYDTFFKPGGSLRARRSDPQTLDEILALYGFGDDNELSDMLHRMLRIIPGERENAKELLDCAWVY